MASKAEAHLLFVGGTNKVMCTPRVYRKTSMMPTNAQANHPRVRVLTLGFRAGNIVQSLNNMKNEALTKQVEPVKKTTTNNAEPVKKTTNQPNHT